MPSLKPQVNSTSTLVFKINPMDYQDEKVFYVLIQATISFKSVQLFRHEKVPDRHTYFHTTFIILQSKYRPIVVPFRLESYPPQASIERLSYEFLCPKINDLRCQRLTRVK